VIKTLRCRAGLGILPIVVAFGCGTVTTPEADGGTGDFTLIATPMALNIPIASSAVATIAVDRVGGAADVMLSAQNLPSGITATFTANPVPAGTNTSDVRFSVAAGTPAGTSNIAIVGASGGHEKTVTIAVTAQTITVAGTVRGGRSGVTVRIVGKAAVTSDSNGGFTFTDVAPPYDLYTVGSSGFSGSAVPTVFYFQGLTRPDPVVSAPELLFFTLFTSNNTTLSGSKTGGDGANAMIVAWDSGGTATTTTGSYSFTAGWSPNTVSRAGTLYGFQFSKKANNAPDVFTGYGSANATLTGTNGQTGPVPATVNLTLTTPQTAALTGSVTSPAGFPTPSLILTQQLGASGSLPLWSADATAVAATIPLVGAGKASLFGQAILDNGASSTFVHPALSAATDVTFAMLAPAVQASPVDTATGVRTTTALSWSATPMTIHQINVVSTTTTGTAKAKYVIHTTAATVTIPAISELALPNNQSFNWFVQGFAPYASIDDAASTAGIALSASANEFVGTRHSATISAIRSFTTAP
jgi:hypothetical protein